MMAKQVQGTQSFSRSISLLQYICDRPSPPNFQNLLKECTFTRPTLYRLLQGLEAEGLIAQTQAKHYEPGPRLINLARNALTKSDIRHFAREELEQLRDETGETVHLAVPSGAGLVYIDKIESPETVRMGSTIGTFVPLHSSGVGKAYLSALPEGDLSTFFDITELRQVTRFTTTDPTELLTQIAQCRRQGYVFDDQENEEGIVCFGAAILDEHSKPVGAVSVSVPLFRLNDDVYHYARPLLECVGKLSGGFG